MEAWIARLREYLALADGGVLILAYGARDDLLAPLVAALLPDHPALTICLDPVELDAAPTGATVIYRPEASHARALNFGRPRVADLALRVVLWCDESVAEALRTDAPDFFDWVSHMVECPHTTPRAAAERLHAAARAKVHVVWRGPQPLRELTVAAGLGDVPRVVVGGSSREPPSGARWWELRREGDDGRWSDEQWAILEMMAWQRGARWITQLDDAPPHWARIDGKVLPLPDALRDAAARGQHDRCAAVLEAYTPPKPGFPSPVELPLARSLGAPSLAFLTGALDAERLLHTVWDMRWERGQRAPVGPELLAIGGGAARWIAPMLLAFNALDRDDVAAAHGYLLRAYEDFGTTPSPLQIGFASLLAGVVAGRLGRHKDSVLALENARKLLSESFGPDAPPALHATIERALAPTAPDLVAARTAIDRMAALRAAGDPDLRAWRQRLAFLRSRSAPAA